MSYLLKIDRVMFVIVLFLVSFVVYLPTLKAPFFWDDDLLIPALKKRPTIPKYTEFRPLRGVSLYLDSFLWRENASGYHFTNIFLNAIAVVCAFYFIDFFFKNKLFSFLTAFLFSLHPVHVETVAWINNRAEIIFFIFFVLSFIFFFKKRWLGLIFFVFSLMAKESAAILPLVLVCYILLFREKKEIKLTIPFWILSLVRLIIGISLVPQLVGKSRPIPFAAHILAVIKTYSFYFYLLLFPKNLSVDWPLDINPQNLYNWLYTGVLVGFFILVWFFLKKKNILFFLLMFFISLLPYSNIVFISGRPLAEQRLYLPSLAFSILLGMLLVGTKKSRYLYSIFMLLVFLYGARTVVRANQWRDIESILLDARKFSPENARIEMSLGNIYSEKKEFARARGYYDKAAKIDPEYTLQSLYNMGLAFMKEKDLQRAGESFRNVLKINPENVPALYNLGLVYIRQNDFVKAIEVLRKAAEIAPDEYQIYNNLAVAYKKNGDWEKAVEVLKEVLKLKPDYYTARYNLAIIYQDAGLLKQARREVKYLLKKFPNDPTFLKLYQELKK